MEIVYTTAPSLEEAEKIATFLVEKGLVACANLLSNVTSIYKWKGSLQKEQEIVIIAKTFSESLNEVINSIERMHSYDTPLVFSVSTSNINKSFLEWASAVSWDVAKR